jgi:hypothetical protein
VLLVSSLQVNELARAANAAGADGYLHKVTTAAEMRDALLRLTAPGAPA